MSTVNEVTAKNGMVVESDLTYAPPEAGEDIKLGDLARDVIAEIEGEFGAAKQADWEAENPFDETDGGDGGEPTPESDTGEPVVEPPKVETPPEEEQDDPKLTRSLERVVARELAAKERETAALAAEAKAKERVAELQALQGLAPMKEVAEMMDLDPVGAFKRMGKDPEMIIKLAMAQQLGDRAPQELKEFSRDYANKREVAQLRAQIQQQEQARQQQEYFNSIANGAREYVTKSVGDSTPILAAVSKANPDRAHREIMEEISRDAATRIAVDPDGQPLTYAEAAKRVEERFTEWKSLLQVQNSTTTATTQAPKKPTASVPPQPKPPAKPLAPWAKRNDDPYEAAIREAEREYHQSEARRKATQR